MLLDEAGDVVSVASCYQSRWLLADRNILFVFAIDGTNCVLLVLPGIAAKEEVLAGIRLRSDECIIKRTITTIGGD